jgi:hypothetical protein
MFFKTVAAGMGLAAILTMAIRTSGSGFVQNIIDHTGRLFRSARDDTGGHDDLNLVLLVIDFAIQL